MTKGKSLGAARRMSVRIGLTTIDQAVCSVSNFAVAVVVARVAGVGGLGAFSVVYAGWLGTSAMHRAFVTDPMAIEGDLRSTDWEANVRAGLAAELVLGLGAAVICGVIGLALLVGGRDQLGIPFVTVAPWFPFLLAQDYWRWIGFMKAEPAKSLMNDVVFDVVQGAAFGLLLASGARSSVLAITVWSASAAVAAVLGLWQFKVRPEWRGGWARLRLRFGLGKWIGGVNATAWGASQSSIVLVGAFLGTAGIGGLKAATTLVSGPALVLIQAGGSVGLPEASRGLHERGWPGLRRVSRIVTAAGVLSMALILTTVLLFGRQLLSAAYGPSFARFAPIADILSLSFCIATLGLGAILSIKATKQPGLLFRVSVVSLVVSVVSVIVLTPRFGIDGAAWSTVITSTVTIAFELVTHWRHSRSRAEALFAAQSIEPHAPSSPSDFGDAVPDVLVRSGSRDGSAGASNHLASVPGPRQWGCDSRAPRPLLPAVITCRSCGGSGGEVVLDLGEQPAADYFPASDDLGPDPVYPLQLWLCARCGLAQLADDASVPQEPKGTEPEALIAQSAEAIDRVAAAGFLQPGRRVLECASPHGGSWLERLIGRGLTPAAPGERPDVVLDCFGLMHEPDQAAALRKRTALVAPGGVLLLQYHSVETIVRYGQWNAIRHGHYGYYSTTALETMLARTGFSPHRAWEFDLYGGTVLLAATRDADGGPGPDPSVRELISREARAGISHPAVLRGLGRDALRHAAALHRWLAEARDAGRVVLGYGAASRAAALLVRAGVDRTLLPGIVDASVHKQGLRMPATDIPILEPYQLVARRPAAVLLFVSDLLAEVRTAFPEVEASGATWVEADSIGA